MPYDRPGLQVLERDECLRLLASAPIGRVAFTVDALPAVQPVTFAMYDEQVVIRTRRGSKLVTGVRDAIVAFEVDDYDPQTHTGWSVTVVGPAATVSEPRLIEQLARLPLPAWAPDDLEHFVLITVMMVHGRRVTRLDAAHAREFGAAGCG